MQYRGEEGECGGRGEDRGRVGAMVSEDKCFSSASGEYMFYWNSIGNENRGMEDENKRFSVVEVIPEE